MIVLDTHIWIWWLNQSPQLDSGHAKAIRIHHRDGLAVSAISCWKIAKLVERQRLKLDRPVLEWIQMALSYPGVMLIELSPEIAVASTQLPGTFHRDPADQIIVATARTLGCPLLTADNKILDNQYVDTLLP